MTANASSVSGSLSLTYDGRGNLANDGTNGYSYDVLNNLLTMNTSSATLTYDALGRLASTTGSSTTQFAYDGGQVIGEYDGSGNLLRRYVPGAERNGVRVDLIALPPASLFLVAPWPRAPPCAPGRRRFAA